MSTDLNPEEAAAPDERRRDFLILVAGAIGGVAAAAVWPLIDSLNPSADTVAADAPVDFDLSPLQPVEQKVVAWRS